jgi:hypothetical protein
MFYQTGTLDASIEFMDRLGSIDLTPSLTNLAQTPHTFICAKSFSIFPGFQPT